MSHGVSQPIRILSALLLVFIYGCSVTGTSDSVERGYTIKLQSTDVVIDTVALQVYVNTQEFESNSYYNDRFEIDSAPVLVLAKSVVLENGEIEYQYEVSFTISANTNDTIEVYYQGFSSGFQVISSERKFILSQDSLQSPTVHVDDNAVSFITELAKLDTTYLEYVALMAEKMCENYNTDTYAQLHANRNGYTKSMNELLYNSVMDCMFTRSFNSTQYNGLNKNLPATLNVDSVFVDRFYSGIFQYEDYSMSPQKGLLPSASVIDSVKRARESLDE